MDKPLTIIGRAEMVQFPELGLTDIPARIDTGAKTASIWASRVRVTDKGIEFVLFDTKSPHYTGEVVCVSEYQERVVASSNGMAEKRYFVRLLVTIGGRKVRGYFSLANRSQQVYPVLVGRNILAGKFLVDVKRGTPMSNEERLRSQTLQASMEEDV